MMETTPKEKAEEIFYKYCYGDIDSYVKFHAKKCAIICVDEIISTLQTFSDLESILVINDKSESVIGQICYWKEVKKEIEKI